MGKKAKAKEAKRDILNLGSGNWLIEGAVHLDRTKHRPEVDVVHDLNELPWPFEDESFDLVVARAVLEHLDIDLITSVDECWRILRPGGELYLKLPYWNAERSWDDPTHRWKFSPGCCNVFDPRTAEGRQYGFYTERKWRIVKGPRMNDARTSIFVTMRKMPSPPAPLPEGEGSGKGRRRKRDVGEEIAGAETVEGAESAALQEEGEESEA